MDRMEGWMIDKWRKWYFFQQPFYTQWIICLMYWPTGILPLYHTWEEQYRKLSHIKRHGDGFKKWHGSSRSKRLLKCRIFPGLNTTRRQNEKCSQLTKVFFKDQLLLKLPSKVASLILTNHRISGMAPGRWLRTGVTGYFEINPEEPTCMFQDVFSYRSG